MAETKEFELCPECKRKLMEDMARDSTVNLTDEQRTKILRP